MSEQPSAAFPIDDVTDLVDRVEVDRFITYELRGRRRDGGFDDVPSVTEPVAEGRLESDYSSEILLMHSDEQIAVRMVTHVGAVDAEYVADMAVVYTLSEPVAPTEDVMHEFIERVAIMTIFPFVRQAISDCSSRLGAPVTMRLIRAGSVRGTDEQGAAD